MDADERSICLYLKSWAGQYVSVREISRRAGGKRKFREDPNWATPVICRLMDREYVEGDAAGHYRLRRRQQRNRSQGKWVSPQVRSILQQSGKDFGNVMILEEPDDFYADDELKG